MPPGTVATVVDGLLVTVEMTIEGDVSSFTESRRGKLVEKLRNYFGCFTTNGCVARVEIFGGSIHAVAVIIEEEPKAGGPVETAAAAARAASMAELSRAFGVPLTNSAIINEEHTTVTAFIPAPSPPPPSPPPPSLPPPMCQCDRIVGRASLRDACLKYEGGLNVCYTNPGTCPDDMTPCPGRAGLCPYSNKMKTKKCVKKAKKGMCLDASQKCAKNKKARKKCNKMQKKCKATCSDLC